MVPSNITVRKLESPTEGHVDEAVQIFCKLMPEDPLSIALTGGDVRHLPYLIRAMVSAVAFMCGEIYAAFNENGVMVGFQGWVPPGDVLFSTEEQRALLADFMSRVSEKARSYVPGMMAVEFPKVIDELSGIENSELNMFWCNFNFVAAEYQQQGISTAMSQLAYQKAELNGWTMGLATTNVHNIAIYHHLGFELQGYRGMLSPFIDWPVWIFVKRSQIKATQ
ncbi:uncharacterized protein C8Q71DRAFT_905652 [Rhodofomes roseus]|uniref:N-acetyltransferase domain-containing protein n=1 Tax=Rhodofomes roseus TaxID=34475 RepID=A0A4Y9Y2J4_9APHY|nr:uncharacterized protein C8Q71DRAFT_905652 [Rhodofomes roseus]KAH9839034.1 hypothetical protein C8Q71DRAFT_905652 [Rhodofomes roseus]TFY55601.1 hypothetical protein EVJ58_g8146 [Rhodofomes roseus]